MPHLSVLFTLIAGLGRKERAAKKYNLTHQVELHSAGLLRQMVELHLVGLGVEVAQELLVLHAEDAALFLAQLPELLLVPRADFTKITLSELNHFGEKRYTEEGIPEIN
jgi:hypothetical protein